MSDDVIKKESYTFRNAPPPSEEIFGELNSKAKKPKKWCSLTDKETYIRFMIGLCNHGTMAAAATHAHVTTAQVKRRLKDWPEFAADYEACKEIFVAEVHKEIRRRAIDGVESDILYKGEVVGTKTTYSDTLLLALAKRHDPGFKEKLQVDATVNGGVLVVPAATMTQEEWEESEDSITVEADEE